MRSNALVLVTALLTVVAPLAACANEPAALDVTPSLDVTHYRIAVRVNPATGTLRGRATLTATAGRRVRLDLALHADEVRVDSTPVAFRHRGLALTFDNPHPGPVRVQIRYHGTPADTWIRGENPWMSTRTEQVASGEPRIAPWWFPSHDVPGDKATFDVIGRVPRGQQFISNGTLVSRRDGRWHWRSAAPMATYTSVMAAGAYRIDDKATLAVAKSVPASNMALLARTSEYVAWLQTQLGPYPFDAMGGIVSGTFRNQNWSMETQTRPTYPDMTRLGDVPELMVHELAHQWFGDSVTPARWQDIWLNEGFARWMEVRYDETHGGLSAHTWLTREYPRHGTWFWNVRIGSPAMRNVLSLPVYERGAMTVQALRQRIGDDAFFTLLRRWTAEHRHGNATVEDFEALAEEVSGQDLTAFFQAWLFTPGRPAATPENGL